MENLEFNVLKLSYLFNDKRQAETMICGCGWQDSFEVADTFRSIYQNHPSNKGNENYKYEIICRIKIS